MASSVPPTPVLDLSTVVDRPFITIDGEQFEIRHPDEFSLVQQRVQHRQAQRVLALVELMAKDESSEADDKEYATIQDQACRQVLIAPDAVHEKLRDVHRLAIVRAFTELLLEKTTAASGATAPTPDPPATKSGTSSSLDSSGSTVETPSGG